MRVLSSPLFSFRIDSLTAIPLYGCTSETAQLLQGFPLPESLRASNDIDAVVEHSEILLLVIPTPFVERTMGRIKDKLKDNQVEEPFRYLAKFRPQLVAIAFCYLRKKPFLYFWWVACCNRPVLNSAEIQFCCADIGLLHKGHSERHFGDAP